MQPSLWEITERSSRDEAWLSAVWMITGSAIGSGAALLTAIWIGAPSSVIFCIGAITLIAGLFAASSVTPVTRTARRDASQHLQDAFRSTARASHAMQATVRLPWAAIRESERVTARLDGPDETISTWIM